MRRGVRLTLVRRSGRIALRQRTTDAVPCGCYASQRISLKTRRVITGCISTGLPQVLWVACDRPSSSNSSRNREASDEGPADGSSPIRHSREATQ